MSAELQKATLDYLVGDAKLRFAIYEHAIAIAKDRGVDFTDGLEALYYLFAEKHHWTPEQVRNLSTDELSVLIKAL
ncbi:hypothetical protein ACR42D_10120 [Desulfovibrio caledoniensis]